MRHEAGTWAEESQVRAPLAHQLELVAFNGFADLIVADVQLRNLWHLSRILYAGNLPVAPDLQCLGSGGVVAVNIDDHRASS